MSKLPPGLEAIAPATDGWGPYKCILAKRDNGRELIPGKLAMSKNMAFFSYGGKEHQTDDYLVVEGTMLDKDQQPSDSDAVGFQTHCPNTPWYGEHFIGIAKVNDNAWGPGKVKDGVLYYGYGGREHQTKEF